jgi:hypothetical protein
MLGNSISGRGTRRVPKAQRPAPLRASVFARPLFHDSSIPLFPSKLLLLFIAALSLTLIALASKP